MVKISYEGNGTNWVGGCYRVPR